MSNRQETSARSLRPAGTVEGDLSWTGRTGSGAETEGGGRGGLWRSRLRPTGGELTLSGEQCWPHIRRTGLIINHNPWLTTLSCGHTQLAFN